jgi:hypothetical protein
MFFTKPYRDVLAGGPESSLRAAPATPAGVKAIRFFSARDR